METIKDIGEQGLLAKLQQFCPRDIIGDDAAVLSINPEKSLVVTTDVLVDGVHFSDRTTSGWQVGWRAAAANLSDLAAMGAYPVGITVGLSLLGETPVSWVESLYQGLVSCLNKYNTCILGGDICRSPVNTVSITALGEVNGDRVIRRSQAQPGDVILITGYHGASRAGLECLLHPEIATKLPQNTLESLIKAHQQPLPRFDVISHLWENVGNIAVAGMDTSDGLADAILQICRASNVGATINFEMLPILPALTEFFPTQALNWTFYGGEDFELVLCLPKNQGEKLQQSLGLPSVIIGEITRNPEVKIITPQSSSPPIILSLDQGFQHF